VQEPFLLTRGEKRGDSQEKLFEEREVNHPGG